MKKLIILPIIAIAFLFCSCSFSSDNAYSDDLRLNIAHINENDGIKDIKISYPIFGGINNKEALTIVNTSIENYVNSEYNEFQNILTNNDMEVIPTEESENIDSDYEETSETDENGENENFEEDSAETENGDSDNSENNTENGDTENSGKDSEKPAKGVKVSLKMTFKITYNKNDYLGVVQSYEKNLGSKNMIFTGQHSFFFSLSNATYLQLNEIFDYEAGFAEMVNNQIRSEIESGGFTLYDNEQGFSSISKNNSFYIDSNNLYIYYDALEISPDKDIIPTFTFPISKVKKYVKEDYKDIFN